jgi:hypothetical protein
MNQQQDEAALVDSFFSPGGLLDPEQRDTINQDDYYDGSLAKPLFDRAVGLMVVPITTTTTIAATHLPNVWNSILHAQDEVIDSRDIGILKAAATNEMNDAFVSLMVLPNHHNNNHPLSVHFPPHSTTERQGPVSPATDPSLMTDPSLNRSEHYLWHVNTMKTFTTVEENKVQPQMPSSRRDDSNHSHYYHPIIETNPWLSRLLTNVNDDDIFQQQQQQQQQRRQEEAIAHFGIEKEATNMLHDDRQQTLPRGVGNHDQLREMWKQHEIHEEIIHLEDDNHNYDVIERVDPWYPHHHHEKQQQQPIMSLRLLHVHSSIDRSMSSTSSLSSTSSCATVTEQQHDVENEEEQEEALPAAVPSVVTTSCKRRRHKHDQSRSQPTTNNMNMHDDFSQCDEERKDRNENYKHYNHDVDEEDKIVADLRDNGHDCNENAGPFRKADWRDSERAKPPNITLPPDPSIPPFKLQIFPEQNVLWSDVIHATSSSDHHGGTTKQVVMVSRNSTPKNTTKCTVRNGGAALEHSATAMLSKTVTTTTRLRETIWTCAALQYSWKYIKGICVILLQKVQNAVVRLVRFMMSYLVAVARLAVVAGTLVYAVVSWLCLESLFELKEHPESISCLVIFYLTPRCCRVVMNHVVHLPYWTPHVVSTALVLSQCYPVQSVKTASSHHSTASPSLSEGMKESHVIIVNAWQEQQQQQQQQQVSAVILWFARIYVACSFVYDGFADARMGSLWRYNTVTRLLLASLLTLVRCERILSPVAWLGWSMQVMVAALLPSYSVATELVVILMSLSTTRYIRTHGGLHQQQQQQDNHALRDKGRR